MTSTPIQNDVFQMISTISTDELESLYKTHEKLNPRGKKETQVDWIKKFEPRKDQIILWAGYFNEKITYLNQTYSISKSNAQSLLSHYLRRRQEQELGYTNSLINPVKISLICTLGKHLGGNSSSSRPVRTTAINSILKVHKSTKSNMKNFKLPKGVKVNSLRGQGNYIFGTLVNSTTAPLQNLKLEVLHKKCRLKIKNCVGENFQLAAGVIHIPFMEASMTTTIKKIEFKFEIDGYLNGDEKLILSLYVDNPELKLVVSDHFPIKIS